MNTRYKCVSPHLNKQAFIPTVKEYLFVLLEIWMNKEVKEIKEGKDGRKEKDEGCHLLFNKQLFHRNCCQLEFL